MQCRFNVGERLKGFLRLNAAVCKITALKKIGNGRRVALASVVSPKGLIHLLDDKLPELFSRTY